MKSALAIFFSLFLGLAYCQNSSTVFTPISLDQGHINDLMRDSEGFMWISTQDGLTKYNGKHYVQYNYNRKDDSSLAHNYVWTTFEDNRSNIWIGLFGGGLCRFNKEEERFYRYDKFGSIASHGLRRLGQLNDSTLVVGTDHGLYLFDLNNDSFSADTTFQQRQFAEGMIHTHSMEIVDSDILVAGENGGYILSTTEKIVIKPDPGKLGLKKISFVKRIDEGSFLIADKTTFLKVSYNATDRRYKVTQRITSAVDITINDCSTDSNNALLIAAEEGLFKIDFDKNFIEAIPHDQADQNGLKDKVAYCIEEIEDGLKWIGTKTQIYQFSERESPFGHILSEDLCDNAILGMTEDGDGNLWIATRRGLGRIKHFDQHKSQWEYFCYDKETNPELRNTYILNIKVIDDQLLVGYRKKGFGILQLLEDDKVIFRHPPSKADMLTQGGSVSNFLEDGEGWIWTSTSGNGVVKWRFDRPERAFQYKNEDGQTDVLSHNYNFGFEELDDEWVACATAAGITVIHKHRDTTYQILSGKEDKSLSGNFIMDFHRDASGQLWVCTDGGINRWNKDHSFDNWTKNEGLPNDNIYGMLEHKNQLWVSSNRGLTRVINKDPLTFKTFSKNDDILNEEHNQFSFYKSKNELLLFGGKKGITVFAPDAIRPNDVDAFPVIESFLLFNKDGKEKLSNHINYTEELVLNHDENFLSFDLSALSYLKPNQNKFRYRLQPSHTEWIELEVRNFLSLNGMAPGRYGLEIQASNNDGVWGSKTKKMDILIKRPIYSRWYAWLSYALLLAVVIYSFYKMRIDHVTHLAQAREDERTKIRERSAQDFHDEVGSLVTKLSLLNQYLLSNTPVGSDDKVNILNKMQTNIQRIRTGMKDFIWVLDPNKDSLESAIVKIKEIGNDLFEHTAAGFQCTVDEDVNKKFELNGVQRRQLILLIKEALHNVVKHAEASRCIIEIKQAGSNLLVLITDDGKGFDPENYDAGYGIKSMRERARKMKGSVEIQSGEGVGSQIKIIIPSHPNGL